jgi:hypothetical protein
MTFETELLYDVSLAYEGGPNAIRRILWTGSDRADGSTRALPYGEVLIDNEEAPVAVRKITKSLTGEGFYHMELADGRELIDLQDSRTHRQWARRFLL